MGYWDYGDEGKGDSWVLMGMVGMGERLSDDNMCQKPNMYGTPARTPLGEGDVWVSMSTLRAKYGIQDLGMVREWSTDLWCLV